MWFEAGKREYTYLPDFQALTPATALQVFTDVIAANNELWVACMSGPIVGFIAMNGSYIDRLYVLPSAQSHGIGTQLLRFAQERSPNGLELHTHLQNVTARKTYERFGFVAVKYGLSPAPECVADVEYHWRPAEFATP